MKRVVVVTGASSGIGKSIATKFKSEQFIVVAISRSKPDIDVDFWYKADLTKELEREKAFAEVSDRFSRCDVLVNNAGVGLYDTWENIDDNALRMEFELNFFAVVHMTKLFLPLLKYSCGTVINTSSVAGKLYVPCMGSYCASKSAVSMFSHSLRAEVKKYNINVLNLIVGRINTGFSSRSYGKMKPPSTPGGGCPNKLAVKVYKAYIKRKRQITYPLWYEAVVPLAKLFSSFYDNINIKKWGL